MCIVVTVAHRPITDPSVVSLGLKHERGVQGNQHIESCSSTGWQDILSGDLYTTENTVNLRGKTLRYIWL